jgi:hypothetical protein
MCDENKHTSKYTTGETEQRHSLRNGFAGSFVISPVSMTLLVTVARGALPRALSTSPGVPGPHDLAARCAHQSRAREAPDTATAIASGPACRDDRAKRPSSKERDARDNANDLGGGVKGNFCETETVQFTRAAAMKADCASLERRKNRGSIS